MPDIDAFLVDANVAWRVTALTSMLFDARTNFGETTLAGAPGVVERRIGVSLRHAFSHRLIGETGVSYGTQDYRGATLTERDLTLNANVEYSSTVTLPCSVATSTCVSAQATLIGTTTPTR